jgi:hypothetical protein
MARTAERQFYAALVERYGVEIADAFMAAVADLRAGADLQRLIAAIQLGDLDAAIAAAHIDAAAYSAMLEGVRAAYVASGTTAAGFITQASGVAAVVRFDVRNRRAELWLSIHSSSLVTRIVDDQRQAVRQALAAGMARGENPRTTALDLVGRVDPSTGKRDGGIIGLTAQQQGAVEAARDQLRSDDPAQLKAYLERKRRDKRFDRSVLKAIREEKPLPAEIAGKALRQYKNRLLQLRGETIGKNEAFTSLQASKQEAYRQAVQGGAVSQQAVRKIWRHMANENPRIQHVEMDGESVGLEEVFVMPDGTRMLYPHDPEAPAKHTLGCHCQADYRIDHLANLAA